MMKFLICLIAIATISSSFSQTVFPYVRLKNGDQIKYDEIKIKGKIKAKNEGDAK